MRPSTKTDFVRLGKKRRGGRTAEEAKALHDQREASRSQPRPNWVAWIGSALRTRRPERVRYIPLGSLRIRHTDHVRAKNWEARCASGHTYVHVIDNGQYPGCRYTHYTYRQHIECWGLVVGGRLHFRIQTDDGLVRMTLAPYRGWHWVIDINGIALVDSEGRRDYHPTASDLLARGSTAGIAVLAREADVKRRETARAQRETVQSIRRAEREGCAVCVLDSLAAGNCRAGTENWARRHGLEPTVHYVPSELLALANGDTDRVRLVVTKALARHRREMRIGCCELAAHKIG